MWSVAAPDCRAADATPAETAPGWREDPVDPKWTGSMISQVRSQVAGMLRRGTFSAGEQAVFDDYYMTYALARWTEVKNRDKLAEYRLKDLPRDFRNSRGAVRDHLNALALGYMSEVAKPHATGGDYHLVVRVNAMLAIGELNAVWPPSRTTPPTPLPATLDVLLPTVTDQNQLDAVKVAALVGILRHARLGAINDPAPVTKAMLTVANSPAASGSGGDGRQWMKARAADVLGELKAADAQVIAALAGMVGDSSLRQLTRCAAATALGKLDYSGASAVNPASLAAALGKMAVDACAVEYKARAVSRRRLKAALKAASDGLAGVQRPANSAGQPQGQWVAELRKPLGAILRNLENKSLTTDQLLKDKLLPEIRNLQALLAKNPGP